MPWIHLSEAEAYLRIRAARLGRQFPRVVQMLGAGELHLSSVKLLAPVLTQDNCEELLSAVRLKSKRDVELLLAQRSPQADVPSVIRKLAQRTLVPERVRDEQTSFSTAVSSSASEHRELAGQAQPTPVAEPQPEPPAPRVPTTKPTPTVSPLGTNRYKLQLTASQQLHDKLRQAQELMRHELPDGDVAQVLERALDVLIAERMKKRFGQSKKPRARHGVAPKSGSRHVPSDVRRAAVARDGLRCSYESGDGKRCEEHGWLQLHHEEPFGRGGPATAANIRLLCRAH